ncbi:MAG: hypothetical protein M1819_002720 [Sarea resinae]|nr:MAG: hypothetical protein M1819_002720 [Sarea resinae]
MDPQMHPSSDFLYPAPSVDKLKDIYAGKSLHDIPTPAAIIDVAKARRNCDQMRQAARVLNVAFRPHVKTHKTDELTCLQLGIRRAQPNPFEALKDRSVGLVVSTLAEAEHLLPLLREFPSDTEDIEIVYGVPLAPSNIPRLFTIAQRLSNGHIGVLIDHPSQLLELIKYKPDEGSDVCLRLHIKLDTGYHRSGVDPLESDELTDLLPVIKAAEASKNGRLAGFYSHAGHSYGGDSPAAAMDLLIQELKNSEAAAERVLKDVYFANRRLKVSVGATPTATSAQNFSLRDVEVQTSTLISTIERMQKKVDVDLHAGVYTLLDLQQLATHARPEVLPNDANYHSLSTSNIALTILVEVASLYPKRSKPEALIAAGNLALGREPCKAYPGWGVITPWNMTEGYTSYLEGGNGWIVGRISQEHGILSWEGSGEAHELEVGKKLRVWPNHACIAGAGFGWYFVVDSDLDPDRIVDIWVRWRGW